MRKIAGASQLSHALFGHAYLLLAIYTFCSCTQLAQCKHVGKKKYMHVAVECCSLYDNNKSSHGHLSQFRLTYMTLY